MWMTGMGFLCSGSDNGIVIVIVGFGRGKGKGERGFILCVIVLAQDGDDDSYRKVRRYGGH